jgi:primosomal replication protein N
VNRLRISGTLTEVDPLRYSPAGVPIAEAVLQHRSGQTVANQMRQVECELRIQASGPLAGRLAAASPGTQLSLEGVLNRRSVNSRQLILIVNQFEKE